MDNCIGSETAHTQRQREYVKRKKEREASLNDGSVTKKLQVGDGEKEKSKSKNIYTASAKENQFTKGAKEQDYDFEKIAERVIKN
jgi:hypothetical protein